MTEPIVTRKPGAPHSNQNKLKHGFRSFCAPELDTKKSILTE